MTRDRLLTGLGYLGGFVLLLMLMVTVIYNDLARIQWIQKLIPWR